MSENVLSRLSEAAQRILSGSSILRSNAVLSYGVGVAAFIPALALRFLLEVAIPNFPYITFIPAVIISAVLAGSRGGVLCAALSLVSAWYWFVDPMDPFSTSMGAVVGLTLFVFIVAVDIATIAIASRVVDLLITQGTALEEVLKEKEVLLYEVNHRVKNSLQLVSSILLLEGSKISESEARLAVMEARDKVDLVARLHQLLYASGTHDRVDLKAALQDIVNHLMLSAGRDDVSVECSFSGDLFIDLRKASPLVLIVNEIITNSLKYGLSSKHPKLTVSANSACDEMTLVIGDNGPGISATTTDKKPSMGVNIVKGLSHQIRATLVIQSDGSGTAYILTVPIDAQSIDRKGAS